jgi:hypothetical protein
MPACPASFFEERFPTGGNDNTIETEFVMLLIFKDLKSCLSFLVSVIAQLGGCVVIT